jgi:hypothetical protein
MTTLVSRGNALARTVRSFDDLTDSQVLNKTIEWLDIVDDALEAIGIASGETYLFKGQSLQRRLGTINLHDSEFRADFEQLYNDYFD